MGHRLPSRPAATGTALLQGCGRPKRSSAQQRLLALYARHPNYFGDAWQRWAFYLVAVAAGGWAVIFSLVLMTFLLVRVSGVAMLERSLRPWLSQAMPTTWLAPTPLFPGSPASRASFAEETERKRREMNKDTLRQLVNVISLIIALTVNGLANALPLNGKMTGEISDSFAVYFVPAGYVFHIGALSTWASSPLASTRRCPASEKSTAAQPGLLVLVRLPVALGFWHYLLFPLTLIAMLTLLVSLIVIYQRLRIGQAPVSAVERWTVNIPFSVYLGWITVANDCQRHRSAGILEMERLLASAGRFGGRHPAGSSRSRSLPDRGDAARCRPSARARPSSASPSSRPARPSSASAPGSRPWLVVGCIVLALLVPPGRGVARCIDKPMVRSCDFSRCPSDRCPTREHH